MHFALYTALGSGLLIIAWTYLNVKTQQRADATPILVMNEHDQAYYTRLNWIDWVFVLISVVGFLSILIHLVWVGWLWAEGSLAMAVITAMLWASALLCGIVVDKVQQGFDYHPFELDKVARECSPSHDRRFMVWVVLCLFTLFMSLAPAVTWFYM
jgi:hypothetical protein